MNESTEYRVAEVTAKDLPWPADRQPHAGWAVAPITTPDASGSAVLKWKSPAIVGASARLRITVGIGIREVKKVKVISHRTRRSLGTFDIRFAPSPQTQELQLSPDATAATIEEGVELVLTESTDPLWILTGQSTASALPKILSPHLYFAPAKPDPLAAFLANMKSLACLQLFGWMEGCVIDGQLALHRKYPTAGYEAAARAHLAEYCRADGRLIYCGPKSEPTADQIHSIEETLMFAPIAKLLPAHPSLGIAKAFWQERFDRFGYITDPGMPSAEGCYTVGYPLSVVARVLNEPKYADWAISALRIRRDRLRVGDDIYLRSYDDGRRTFMNWSRGVAWYFVGLVKTIHELGDRADISDLKDEARRLASWLLTKRTSTNIWNCFVGESATPPDTAGSSGIAAGLAIGAATGLLDASALPAARLAVETLKTYLTPDGLLTGVSQSNCGGEPMQRGEYRVIFPMGMGLLAQAIAWSA